jgi:hypothetical protein
MKTSILRTVCFALCIFLASNFVTKAQDSFCDTKWENGRRVSATKYVLGYNGLYERESVSKYTYDDKGDFLEKEVYVWNPKYVWHDKAGKYPDYSESNWIPQYRILQKKDLVSDMVSLELLCWNKEKKAYDQAIEKIIYRLDNTQNRFYYYAFQKGDKFVEEVNQINFKKELLAELWDIQSVSPIRTYFQK